MKEFEIYDNFTILPNILLNPSINFNLSFISFCQKNGEDGKCQKQNNCSFIYEICLKLKNQNFKNKINSESFVVNNWKLINEIEINENNKTLSIGEITHLLPNGWKRKTYKLLEFRLSVSENSENKELQKKKYIPKIIHQIWNSNEIPENTANYVKSWGLLHPLWEYRFWQYSDIENVLMKMGWSDDWIKLWKFAPIKFKYLISCSVVVFNFGGVCVRIDVEALRPFDELISDSSIFFGLEPIAHRVVFQIQNQPISETVIGSVPSHPFWTDLTENLLLKLELNEKEIKTSKLYLNSFLSETISSFEFDSHNPPTIFKNWILHPKDNPNLCGDLCNGESTELDESFSLDHWIINDDLFEQTNNKNLTIQIQKIIQTLPKGWQKYLTP